ncbi:copper resistance protein CopC [Herbiconiux sp. P15]|uniref:copper resistance CopC family protein n=1 Tax=Herbiconiux liukaitaii TaxID=3342799 RepID=UPI0035BB6EA8
MRRRSATAVAATVAAGLLLAGVAGVGVGAVGGASSASAHDYLVSTNPAADATVTEALTEVALDFNEPPLTDFASAIAIEVRDASGADVVTTPVSIVDSTLTVSVAPTTQGAYTVLWQTVSSDGHPVSGEYAFTYSGPVAQPTAEPTAAPPASSSEPPTAAPTPSASPGGEASGDADPTSSEGGSDGSGALVWVGIGGALAVLAIAGVIVAVVLTRRRSTP